MPGTISHVLSATTPDDPNYEIRPSHWNSSHLLTLNAVGSEISGAFSNGNNVTFGFDGTHVTASVVPPSGAAINISAGSTSTAAGAFTFNNSNGVTFGLGTGASAGNITATVATNYQSQGAYLTTAMQSNAATISNINVSGGASSANVSAITFSNANGVTFGYDKTNVTASVATNYQSQGAYLTTAMQSNAATISNINVSAGATSNNLSALTFNNSNGVSFGLTGSVITATVATNYQSQGAYLTTAMQSGASTQFVQANAAFAGTNASGTIASSGISVSVAAQSNQTLGIYASSNTTSSVTSGTVDARNLTFVGAGALSVGYSNGSVILSAPSAAAGNVTFSAGANSAGLASVVFSNSNGVSFGLNGSTITASAAGGGVAISNSQTMFTSGTVNLLEGGGAITIASSAGGQSLKFSVPQTSSLVGTNGISVSTNGSTISVMGTFIDRLAPWDYSPAASATSTGGLGTLHVFPFIVDTNLTFNQVNMIGSANLATTTYANTMSATAAANSSIGFSYTAGFTMSRFFDFFIFQRGTGGFSTEIETVVSTRNSFVTFETVSYLYTNSDGALSASATLKHTHSYVVSIPSMTSGTATSVNAASTVTTWQPGYTGLGTSTTGSTSSSAVNATLSISIAPVFTTSFFSTGQKMVPFAFAGSLSAGQYWLGVLQNTSSSSSSGNTFANTAAGNSLATTINASVMTSMGSFSTNGMTSTVASSLGFLGFASQATMAPSPGQGSFSATWASNTTYNNNAGNPAGAIGFNQISTNASFWRPWFEFANNRI